MTSLFAFLSPKKNIQTKAIVEVDIHSHLLAGIDDGVSNMEQALAIIKKFMAMGYKKIVTTPHIMQDFYRNTPSIISEKLKELKDYLNKNDINIEIEAAAEYYLDEAFLDNLQKKSEILCFGKPKYVLFETGFLSMPPFIDEAIFLMQAEGYTPILAHPERYIYLYDNINYLEKMREMGVLLQVNLLSLAGYYSKESKKMAEKLIDAQLLSFLSSDCHHQKHIDAIEHLYSHYNFSKIQKLKLLNNSLLD